MKATLNLLLFDVDFKDEVRKAATRFTGMAEPTVCAFSCRVVAAVIAVPVFFLLLAEKIHTEVFFHIA